MNNKKDFLKQIISDTGVGIKGYMKAQFKLMFISFIILSIGLTVIDVKLPVLIAAGISILDIIPVLGAGIVMIPWSIISFIIGNKDMGANIAIIYAVLVIVRQFIEPKILGKEIGIRPLYTFMATILGAIVLGPIGVIVGPLIAVVINSIIKIKKR